MKPPRVYPRGILPFFGGFRRSTLLRLLRGVGFHSEAVVSTAGSTPRVSPRGIALRANNATSVESIFHGASRASAFADRSRLWPTKVGGSDHRIHPWAYAHDLLRRRIKFYPYPKLQRIILLTVLTHFPLGGSTPRFLAGIDPSIPSRVRLRGCRFCMGGAIEI